MQKGRQSVGVQHEAKLRALCALSNVQKAVDVHHLVSSVQAAPDPETAVREVLRSVPEPSEVLNRKWRSVITDLWASHHPNIPLLPELSLSAADVAEAPFLRDAHAFLNELDKNPAAMISEQQEWLLAPDEVARFALVMPSMETTPTYEVENEWGYIRLRRLRAVLQLLRLVRSVKGHVVPVQSRVKKFRSLPPTQQFYMLWHADAYHVNWTEYAGLWGKYMRVVQEYLPLLWEAINPIVADRIDDRAHWCMNVLEAFTPLWDDEGLLDVRRGAGMALHVVQQHALPTIIDRFLLRDLLEAHGLVTIKEEFGSISKFTWTSIGAALVPAEGNQQLPCGLELLSNDHIANQYRE